MKPAGVGKFLGVVLLTAIAFGISGCGAKQMFRKGVRGADLIPLAYPHSGLRAGSIGTGNPGTAPDQYRPSDQNFSEPFLASVAQSDAAWFGRDDYWKRRMKAMTEPGTSGEVLRKLRIADGNASVRLKGEGIRFVDWGELREENIDLQRLSEAIVRGWYNMNGPAMSVECLAMLRPDDRKLARQWWIVSRSVASEGLQYEVSRELGQEIELQARQQIYMSGEVVLENLSSTSTSLKINKPMVLGYDVVTLREIKPPLPVLKDAVRIDAKDHVFTWRDRDTGRTTRIRVDQEFLREASRRQSGGGSALPGPGGNLAQELKGSGSVPVSMFAEARPAGSAMPWRPLPEGSRFGSGEVVRLTFTLTEPGCVYLLSRDSQGQAAVLYPRMPGETLSIGEPVRLPAGTWRFPSDFSGSAGMAFPPGSHGVESFLLVATREPSARLASALAQYARDARANAAGGAETFALPGITRMVSHYVETTTSNAEPVQMPAFSGIDGATVFSVSLNVEP